MNERFDPEKRFNERAKSYDDDIENTIPGYKAMHNLSHHILKSSLPEDASLLIAGSGTGNEAIEYALDNLGWRIVGFDIAAEMIKKASSKITQSGLQNRIELVHGGIDSIAAQGFDGATSLLIAHFLPDKEKEDFLKGILNRLKPGGKFIIADLCDDSNQFRREELMSAWKSFQLQKRDQKDIEEMFNHIREELSTFTVEENISLLEKTGFKNINHFWKSLLINGFAMDKAK